MGETMVMVKHNTIPSHTTAPTHHYPVSYTDLTSLLVTTSSSYYPTLHPALLIVHYGEQSAVYALCHPISVPEAP